MSRIPEYSTRMAGPEGKITPEWAKYFRKIEQDVATNAAFAPSSRGSANLLAANPFTGAVVPTWMTPTERESGGYF